MATRINHKDIDIAEGIHSTVSFEAATTLPSSGMIATDLYKLAYITTTDKTYIIKNVTGDSPTWQEFSNNCIQYLDATSSVQAQIDSKVFLAGNAGGQSISGGTLTGENLILRGNIANTTTGQVNVLTSLDASSTTVASLTTAGGLGVAKKVFFGDTLSIASTLNATSPTTAAVTIAGGLGVNLKTFFGDDINLASGKLLKYDGVNLFDRANTFTAIQTISNTTDASSVSIASLTTAGGLGVAKKSFFGDVLSIKGNTNTDYPTNSAEFLTDSGWTSTDWTGSFVTGWSHTTSNTSVLSYPTSAVISTRYNIIYTVSNRNAGSFTVSFGGYSKATISTSGSFGLLSSNTNNLTITPTSDFDGTLIISVKSLTLASTPIIEFRNSNNAIRMEIRNTSGQNTFIGNGSGTFTMGGTYNVGLGTNTLSDNISGGNNIAIGNSSNKFNTSGYFNISIGSASLGGNITGYSNIAIGDDAGRYLTNGSTANTNPNNSIYIGLSTRVSADNNTNEIVIGNNTTGNGSNTITLGNSSVTTTYISSDVNLASGKVLKLNGTSLFDRANTWSSLNVFSGGVSNIYRFNSYNFEKSLGVVNLNNTNNHVYIMLANNSAFSGSVDVELTSVNSGINGTGRIIKHISFANGAGASPTIYSEQIRLLTGPIANQYTIGSPILVGSDVVIPISYLGSSANTNAIVVTVRGQSSSTTTFTNVFVNNIVLNSPFNDTTKTKNTLTTTYPVNFGLDTASTDAYTITLNPPLLSYEVGAEFTFKAVTANTGAATLTINSLAATPIVKGVNTALSDSDILTNMFCKVVYDGTNFVLYNPRTL